MNKTSSNSIMIDFPEVRQSKDFTCGASALQAILYYYGLSYREEQLGKILKSSKNKGTLPSDMVKFCRKLGLHVTERHHMTIDEVKYYLGMKIPILVVFQAWGDPNMYEQNCDSGHYSVIIGMKGNKIIFEDPSIIGKGFIKTADFLNRWHDCDVHGNIYDHYGMMIFGLPIVYDSHKFYEIQ